MQAKIESVSLLALSLSQAVKDCLLAINLVLLQLVGHHTLHWLKSQPI